MKRNGTFEHITPSMEEVVEALFHQVNLVQEHGDIPADLGVLYSRTNATISIHHGLRTWALIRLGRRSGRIRGVWAKGSPDQVIQAINLFLKINASLSPEHRSQGTLVRDLKESKAAAKRAHQNRLTKFRVARGDYQSPVVWNRDGGIDYSRTGR